MTSLSQKEKEHYCYTILHSRGDVSITPELYNSIKDTPYFKSLELEISERKYPKPKKYPLISLRWKNFGKSLFD